MGSSFELLSPSIFISILPFETRQFGCGNRPMYFSQLSRVQITFGQPGSIVFSVGKC